MSTKHLDDLTAQCIRCGFCLESCPTFTLTADETHSPRGRIALTRAALNRELSWEEIRTPIEACLGCRACEPACPSAVQYGHILELAREKIGPSSKTERVANIASNPQAIKLQNKVGNMLRGRQLPNLIANAFTVEPGEVTAPKIREFTSRPLLDEETLLKVKGEVYLLQGCGARTLFPGVEDAVRRLLRRVGFTVRNVDLGCCGAIHAHSGLLDEARKRARELMLSADDPIPIVVESAGCASTIKDYDFLFEGSLSAPLQQHGAQLALPPQHGAGEVASPRAEGGITLVSSPLAGEMPESPRAEGVTSDITPQNVASRVIDLNEFLIQHGILHLLKESPGFQAKIAYHDACHLAHAQGIKQAPRDLLAAIPGVELISLPESDMCCGGAGIYGVMHPKTAGQLRDRKVANIKATEAKLVALANPGCHAWIDDRTDADQNFKVLRIAELLELSFG